MIRPYGPAPTGPWDQGFFAELYINQPKIPFMNQESIKSDYIELSMDYEIKNAKTVTGNEAFAQNLDTRSWSKSGITMGLRTSADNWQSQKTFQLNGTKKGTLTVQLPRGRNAYEIYFRVANMSFDELKLSNMVLRNAAH